MTPLIIKLNNELLKLYSEQFTEYYSLYENKKYFFFDYLVTGCEYIIYSLETNFEPTEEVKNLLIQYESLLSLLKLGLEKDLNNPKEYYKLSSRNKKHYSQKKQRIP